MNDNKFKLLLGGIALAADSLFFDSFLSKIKEELLILCISLAVLSLIYLGIRKLVLHKSIAMTKTMGILVISMIIVLSIGINYLISPKKEIPPTNSLIRPTYDIPDDYKKYANLGLEDAQVFAFDMYRESGFLQMKHELAVARVKRTPYDLPFRQILDDGSHSVSKSVFLVTAVQEHPAQFTGNAPSVFSASSFLLLKLKLSCRTSCQLFSKYKSIVCASFVLFEV